MLIKEFFVFKVVFISFVEFFYWLGGFFFSGKVEGVLGKVGT